MIFGIFGLLFVARSCMTVTVIIDGNEVNCNQNCVCCKGGQELCTSDNACLNGCVDTIYGNRCNNTCPGNCYACSQMTGKPCHTCRPTFYDTNSMCNNSCSVGCDGGTCDDDGNCSPCTAYFEGNKCDTCKQGFTGTFCTACTTGYYGADCKQCPSGCSNGNCTNDGTCDQCIDNYYGTYCNLTCSVGCKGEVCIQDGSCTCKENFNDANCETCREGKYGTDCQHICSIGCLTSTCDRSNGFCACLPNFTGSKCDQCSAGIYGQSCALRCSDNCKGKTCSRYDGKCTSCVDGYSGNNCTTVCNLHCATCDQSNESICLSCVNENTGPTCSCPPNCNCIGNSDKCTSCYNLWTSPDYQCKCHAKYCRGNGCNECLNNTYFVTSSVPACCECPPNCKGGLCFTGPQCTDGCEDGFYGMECYLTCTTLNVKCSKCSQISGKCLKCNDGFYPDENGSCIRCKSNCMNMQCSSDTGTCLIGCTETFWGDMCDSQCNSNCETCQQESGICDACFDNTFHGSYCNLPCSSSCFESKCEQSSGHCSIGCRGDFFGHLCQLNCPENCQQNGTETRCNANGKCAFGCADGHEGDDCTKRQMDMGSPTNIALAVLSGVLGILFIFTAAGCYLWNRRLSKSAEQSPGIQLDTNETERTYKQLQRQANDPTYRNVDENYSVLSM